MNETKELMDYVLREDAFRWIAGDRTKRDGVLICEISLTSQRWQGIPWKHRLQLFVPDSAALQDDVLLYVTHSGGEAETSLGCYIAQTVGMACAFLYDIPNQPLFDNLVEDALIAHTFARYLDTGDPQWPLLFPMTKSVVRAMDALQEFGRQEGLMRAQRFVVTGASKRGWTTWLTAAADSRVAAIIPMVYDNLNLLAQIPHQIQVAGVYSEQINDYTALGLQERMRTPEGLLLTQMVDPYTYRDRLTMPKLIINGTNDRYWMTDALNLYWADLRGDKSILYLPNNGHNLTDMKRLLSTTFAFLRASCANRPLPRPAWNYSQIDRGVRLEMSTKCETATARCWIAQAPGNDFRDALWRDFSLEAAKRTDDRALRWRLDLDYSEYGSTAVFGEVEIEEDGWTYPLSTQIAILSGIDAVK